MKIFNWVHRRFNHKDGATQNDEKKNGGIAKESVEIENDHEQFLVVHNAFDDVLDGWKGGILTIGTFGYHPLLKDQNDWPTLEEESEKEEVSLDNDENENEEVDPLVYEVYNAQDDYEGLLEMKMDENCVASKDEFEFKFEFGHVMMMKKNAIAKKERTTLADLFIADSEDPQKKEPKNKKGEILVVKEKMNNNNNNNNYKNGFNSFPKNLIGGEGRPIHKLNRLMRRILKRKIHPDLGLNKYDSKDSKVWETKCEINESASLLSIQDAAII